MTIACVVLALLCLAGFVVAWPPGGLLLAGLGLLLLANVRRINQKGGDRP